ncbi:MAG: hypothetical protein CSA58_06495 [Micrococcales bacterium]|nr:MAG: hypothetical protein CSA58_06495 [Micrococcales bacterium]
MWLLVVRGEVKVARAASQVGVGRSRIIRVRQVAHDGALAVSEPGWPGESAWDVEWAQAHAEIERFGEVVKGLVITF